MNRWTREYRCLLRICEVTGMAEKDAARCIRDAAGGDVGIRVGKGADAYLLAAAPSGSGRYLAELYAVRDRRLVLRYHVRLSDPFPGRGPALAAIFGTILLMGIAGAAAGAFYFTAVQHAEDDSPRIDVHRMQLIAVHDGSTEPYMEMLIVTSEPSLRVSVGEGGMVDMMDDGRLDGSLDGIPPDPPDPASKSGYMVRYDGLFSAAVPLSEGDNTIVYVEYGGASAAYPVRVGGP
ncbi:hypothetical protein CENSYa_0696 [Cenarchaeum symbiosum A]|uniref:Uncharacterized protein n=1 Tax=Cenarchaeum symbiosum (strain A) TaxID=414004 RepID=A0RVG2_CENSY|nr:hypothetical protein CENSYa_0696 [Cenarchaeum symbiosum A]